MNYYKNHCFRKESLRMESEEYAQVKKAYYGGFTHAKSFMVDKDNEYESYDSAFNYEPVMPTEVFKL